jgi:hypothetical protein
MHYTCGEHPGRGAHIHERGNRRAETCDCCIGVGFILQGSRGVHFVVSLNGPATIAILVQLAALVIPLGRFCVSRTGEWRVVLSVEELLDGDFDWAGNNSTPDAAAANPSTASKPIPRKIDVQSHPAWISFFISVETLSCPAEPPF